MNIKRNHNFGKPMNEAQKVKISQALKGKPKSEEHKRKVGLSGIGRRHTEETKRLMSVLRMGKRHSEETKRKIAIGVKKDNPKTSINMLLRKVTAYKDWRREVYIRDNFTCQDCGAKCMRELRVRLNAHHIKEFALYPELRFDVSNGLTLCASCHKQRHNNCQVIIDRYEKFSGKKANKI